MTQMRLRHCQLAWVCLSIACNPTLNWREVPVKDTPITALMPCKPDASSRKINLAGHDVEMFMQSCEADGATFAVAHVSLPDADQVPAALAHWQKASWAHAGVVGPEPGAVHVTGAAGPQIWWLGKGQRSNGDTVEVNAMWVVQGQRLVQAAIYAPASRPAWRETFFDGLKLQ